MASGARRRPFHPIAKSSGVISKKILSSVSPPPCNRRGLSANCTRPVRVVWHGQVDVPGVRKMRDDLRHRIVALRAPRIRMRLRARSKMEFFRRSAKRFEGRGGSRSEVFPFFKSMLKYQGEEGYSFSRKEKRKINNRASRMDSPLLPPLSLSNKSFCVLYTFVGQRKIFQDLQNSAFLQPDTILPAWLERLVKTTSGHEICKD